MKTLKSNYLPWGIVVGLLIYLFVFAPGKEVVTITIPSKSGEKIIDAPKPIVKYDTIYEPGKEKPVLVEVKNPVNEELKSKYLAANDSIEKLNLYILAVTQREYVETLSDSIQDITVFSRVTGTLDYQEIKYVTKEKEVEVKINTNRTKVFAGPFVRANVKGFGGQSVGLGLSIVNKKSLVRGGYDNNGFGTLGYEFKF